MIDIDFVLLWFCSSGVRALSLDSSVQTDDTPILPAMFDVIYYFS